MSESGEKVFTGYDEMARRAERIAMADVAARLVQAKGNRDVQTINVLTEFDSMLDSVRHFVETGIVNGLDD